MAKFYLHSGVIGLRKRADEEAEHPIPAGATGVTEFDEGTNAAIVAEFDAAYSRFSYIGGVLNRDGSPVVFAADSPERANLSGFRSEAVQAIADNQTFINLASPSNAQNVAQVKALTRQMNRAIRLILRLDAKGVFQ